MWFQNHIKIYYKAVLKKKTTTSTTTSREQYTIKFLKKKNLSII